MFQVRYALVSLLALFGLVACGTTNGGAAATPGAPVVRELPNSTATPNPAPAAPVVWELPVLIATPTPNRVAPSAAIEAVPPAATPTAAPRVEVSYSGIDESWKGKATASLEERIFVSDVVVRARLATSTSGALTFASVQYLKGTGPARFTVAAETDGRDTQWDDQDAILFLAALPQGASTGFEFADSTSISLHSFDPPRVYSGALPEGYMPDTRNPVWLPVATAAPVGGASGASGSSDKIIVDIDPQTQTSETVTGSELATAIAWVAGPTGGAARGAGGAQGSGQYTYSADDYLSCLQHAFRNIRDDRDREADGATLPRPSYLEAQITPDDEWDKNIFGATVNHDWSFGVPGPKYPTFELRGRDAERFAVTITDHDEEGANGFTFKTTPTRPLPSGAHKFEFHTIINLARPCNFHPDDSHLAFTVSGYSPRGVHSTRRSLTRRPRRRAWGTWPARRRPRGCWSRRGSPLAAGTSTSRTLRGTTGRWCWSWTCSCSSQKASASSRRTGPSVCTFPSMTRRRTGRPGR